MEVGMEHWAIVLSAISALFAAVAALANLGQAQRASQANEVNVYLSMLKEYRSEEMREAISTMASLFRMQNGAVAEWYRAEALKDPQNAEKLYNTARVITSYFVHCAKLFETGFISKKVFENIISHPGINIFYQVATPLTLARNPKNDVRIYAPFLKRFVGQHGDGIIY
jgi:hypothetical protein